MLLIEEFSCTARHRVCSRPRRCDARSGCCPVESWTSPPVGWCSARPQAYGDWGGRRVVSRPLSAPRRVDGRGDRGMVGPPRWLVNIRVHLGRGAARESIPGASRGTTWRGVILGGAGGPVPEPWPIVTWLRADGPLISPSRDLDGESPVAERGDDQAAADVGGIRLRMAPGARARPGGRGRSPSPLGRA